MDKALLVILNNELKHAKAAGNIERAECLDEVIRHVLALQAVCTAVRGAGEGDSLANVH